MDQFIIIFLIFYMLVFMDKSILKKIFCEKYCIQFGNWVVKPIVNLINIFKIEYVYKKNITKQAISSWCVEIAYKNINCIYIN